MWALNCNKRQREKKKRTENCKEIKIKINAKYMYSNNMSVFKWSTRGRISVNYLIKLTFDATMSKE